jgi:hypothetical protein
MNANSVSWVRWEKLKILEGSEKKKGRNRKNI